ncbi:MAG: hypothetical protein PHG85_00305 [Candidatus Altiarchaeota archaeon]|nr:hypothetical protein [Candidatus Altiarchaeota archaeon]
MAKRKKAASIETTDGGQPDAGQHVASAGKGQTPRQDWYLAGGLFLIALLLRLRFVNAGLFYTDAVIAAQNAEATYNTLSIHYMHGVGYPGHVIMIAVLYAIAKLFFGVATAESSTLFISLFTAALSVGLLYLLVRKMGGSKFAGISAALVLNTLPVYLSTSTFGMSHQPAGLFMLLSFYLAMLAAETGDVRLKLAAPLSLGWAAAIRLETIQMLPLMLLFYWIKRPPASIGISEGYLKFRLKTGKDELVKDAAYAIIPAIIMLAIPYIPMLRESGLKTLIDAFEYNRWLGLWVSGLTELVIEWVTISLTQYGWLLVLFGMAALFARKEKGPFIAMLLWCFYFLVLANTLTVEDRHTIPALIGFTVAIGFALDWAYRRIHAIAGIAIMLALLGIMLSTIYPILDYRANFCGPKSFTFAIKDIIEKNSVVIVMDEAPHLQYYGGLDTIGHPLDGDMVKIEKSLAELHGYLANGTNVYLVSSAFVYDSGAGISYDQSSGRLYNTQTRKVFENLQLNKDGKSMTDTSTGVSIPIYGIWQMELFSEFTVLPLKSIENEDWHKRNVITGKYDETLFRITDRPANQRGT